MRCPCGRRPRGKQVEIIDSIVETVMAVFGPRIGEGTVNVIESNFICTSCVQAARDLEEQAKRDAMSRRDYRHLN